MLTPIDLGTITNRQKRTAIKIVSKDDNGHAVPNFNPIQLTCLPASSVTFENVTSDDAKTNHQFDVKSTDYVGPVTIARQGLDQNFGQHYRTEFSLTVTLDPSVPGLPTHFELVDAGVTESI